MAVRSETLEVTGIRCERCVMRLGSALQQLDGIVTATASLMGQVSLAWEDTRVDRDAIVAALARSGFHTSQL